MLVNLAKASEDTALVHEDLFRYQLVTGSNVLPFSFMGKMAFGGYITPAATASIESHLKTQNRAGYMQSVGLVFYPLMHRFNAEQYTAAGKKAEIVSIGIRNIQMAGLTFSGDAFRLVFRGNGYYKGKTLDVGSNNFFALGMNTVDFGISVPKSKRIEKLYFSNVSTRTLRIHPVTVSIHSLRFGNRKNRHSVTKNSLDNRNSVNR
jgi:hypothetical protein